MKNGNGDELVSVTRRIRGVYKGRFRGSDGKEHYEKIRPEDWIYWLLEKRKRLTFEEISDESKRQFGGQPDKRKISYAMKTLARKQSDKVGYDGALVLKEIPVELTVK
jgi:hypothetical protein